MMSRFLESSVEELELIELGVGCTRRSGLKNAFSLAYFTI